jgi:hypothetical protein
MALAAPDSAAQEEEMQLAEPFRNPYAADDATGDHVIALWQFDAGAEAQDASGNGHELELRGAAFATEGRFGGALESFPGWPVEDEPHKAIAKNDPRLTPKGAFTIEMWISPKPEIAEYPEAFLLDKKYVDHTDYQLTLSPGTGTGTRQLQMRLGFGEDTVQYTSRAFGFEPDVWHHIAFTYDGAGEGRFFIDGTAMGSETHPGRGAIAPGKHPVHIGDRVGSYYHGFPGFIDQVRISNGALEFRPVGFEIVSLRRVFVRMEESPVVEFAVTNRQREKLAGATAFFSLAGLPAQEVAVPELEPGAQYTVEYEIDTRLRPDEYTLRATIEMPGDEPYRSTEEFAITTVPRPLPHRMPVVMWGAGLGEVDRLKDLGFTHCIGVSADFGAIWEAGASTQATSDDRVASMMSDLDYALANGIGAVAGLSPGRWARDKEEFRRVGPDGKPYENRHDVCGRFPEIRDFCYNVGASVAQTYGSHPGFQTAMVHTEVRGESELCYHDRDREAFRQFAGFDIPEGLKTKNGTPYQGLDQFPPDRVIPDDYPMYVYYRWFWKEGDGWNDLHTAVHQGLKSTGREDLWTFHDPAVRVASVYGSGGEVDYLSQWTYSYPDPIRIALATDELFCMAKGASRPDQQVMKMTQIIWYRSQTAPEPGEEAKLQDAGFADKDVRPKGTGSIDASGRYQAAWEMAIPDARFITIAPMHLREAFWTKMARPIQGIMYHGWQSLVDVPTSTGGYRYTHPETKHELRRLVRTVVEPLGPALTQVPDRKSDVAFLESFASQMFAKRGTYGWNGGWAGDVYLVLQYAQLQPQVVYDETIEQNGLEGYKVLVAVDCDVLTKTVADAIQAFQDAGGIVIGDEDLCPAIQPDILLPRHDRPKEADMARAGLMELTENLRAELDPHYRRYASSSTPNVVTRVRSYGPTDYLFAVNDLREFGDYVGHHGLVMENGLPTDAVLYVNRDGGHVYDLVAHREVGAGLEDGRISLPWDFGPCEGRVFMITKSAINGVRVTAPEQAAPGDAISIEAAVVDAQGEMVDAIVPVELEILDPHGRPAEFSGYYGAEAGQLQVAGHIAPNDVPGMWRIRVQELASGKAANAYMRVTAD